jgi:hypothetical protein
MAAPELYAPRRPDTGRARPGRQITADPARRRGLVYRVLTSGIAIAVIGGFGYYAWSAYNGERTTAAVSDEVAVIAASTDPLKTPPENPGGIAVQGSDYEFFASVDGERLEIRPDEEFVLPPPEAPITEPSPEIFDRPPPVPVELADTGAAENATAEPAVYEVAAVASRPVALAGVSVPPVLANPMLPLPIVEQGALTAEAENGTAAPVSGAQSAIDTLVASMAGESAPVAATAAQPVSTGPATPAATAPAGAATVQLASMLSEELAQEEWSRLSRLLPDLLANRQPIIRASTSNDRTYYRVSVAATDRVEAAALCAEIKNLSLDCIVHN